MIEVLFSNCTLTWRVNIYLFRQGRGMNRRNEKKVLLIFVLLKRYSHFTTQLIVVGRKLFREKLQSVTRKINFQKKNQFSDALIFFHLRKLWQRLQTNESWQLFQGKHKRLLRTASCRLRSLQEIPKSILHKFRNWLKAGLLKDCPRNLVEQSDAF